MTKRKQQAEEAPEDKTPANDNIVDDDVTQPVPDIDTMEQLYDQQLTDSHQIDQPVESEEPSEDIDMQLTEAHELFEYIKTRLPDFNDQESFTLSFFIAQRTETLEQYVTSLNTVISALRQGHPDTLDEFFPQFLDLYFSCQDIPMLAVLVMAAKINVFSRKQPKLF